MMQHVVTAWVRARLVGVLGFGVLFFVLLSAFTLAGAFFGFDFAGERTPYQVFQDSDFEPPAYKCLYKEQPCPFDPSEICCIPHPDAYFQFGIADTTASHPESATTGAEAGAAVGAAPARGMPAPAQSAPPYARYDWSRQSPRPG